MCLVLIRTLRQSQSLCHHEMLGPVRGSLATGLNPTLATNLDRIGMVCQRLLSSVDLEFALPWCRLARFRRSFRPGSFGEDMFSRREGCTSKACYRYGDR